MPRNRQLNRRLIVGVTVIVVAAITGLLLTTEGQVSADRSLGGRLSAVTTGSVSEPASSPSETIGSASGSVVGPIVRMFSALAIVVVVAYLALYLLKRLMGRRYSGSLAADNVEVLQTTYVGPHKAISLVRVGNRSVLVGVTESQISTLTELDATETSEILSRVQATGKSESFAGIFASATTKLKEISIGKKRAALEVQ